ALARCAPITQFSRGSFPPAYILVDTSSAGFANGTTLWVELFPSLEQDNLRKRWDYSVFRTNGAGGRDATAAQVVGLLVCPSDPLDQNPADWTDFGFWPAIAYGA